jgi:hypothetical protein
MSAKINEEFESLGIKLIEDSNLVKRKRLIL